MENEPLRATRERIYRKYIKQQGLFPRMKGRVLSEEPDAARRRSNFLVFVDRYFSEKVTTPAQLDAVNAPAVNARSVSILTLSSDGYKAFVKFADTPYGSSVIKDMVDKTNLKDYAGFAIAESSDSETWGSYDGIVIAWKFPFKPKFFSSGQVIDPLAILYREFSFTRVFQATQGNSNERDLRLERDAVMKFENPVRIYNKHEPRYSYVHQDGSRTINILTGEVGLGVLTVNKNNPAELVERTHKDALK